MLLSASATQAQIGTVQSESKISATSGGLGGVLHPGDGLGSSIAALGDLDGDRLGELAVGAPNADEGVVWILFLNSDGSVRKEQRIGASSGGFGGILVPGDRFGSSVGSLGDLDGDGTPDLAVGSSLDGHDGGSGGKGAVWILFLKPDGTVKAEQKIGEGEGGFGAALPDLGLFGSALALIGDLDRDGVGELAVGSAGDEGGLGRGVLWILFLNSDGTVKAEQKIGDNEGGFGSALHAHDAFGCSVATLGDLDGDGIDDLAVGAQGDDDGGTAVGAVWILFLNSDGTVKAEQKISTSHGGFSGDLRRRAAFGASVAALGDRDGDGVDEIAVGAPGAERGGATWILFLNHDGTVRSALKIAESEGGFTGDLDAGDGFGCAVLPLGDLNGDKSPDLAVGARADDDGGEDQGAVWILFGFVPDVPLAVISGTELGFTVGASFLDYDADGWLDVYVNYTAELRRNVDGAAFLLAGDLDAFLPQPQRFRYGASCADYDNDGLPDIALETRGDCLYILKNLDGAGHFQEVASNPEIVLDRPQCLLACETFCWADVDEDGDLDLFAPAYPDSVAPGSGGNHFFENLGPTGPGGSYRLAQRTAEIGLEIPPGVARPEGAQFADLDRDGDLDLYSNGTLYQNATDAAGPLFRALSEAETGITRADRLDEGALFFDFDMDGDEDLLALHESLANDLYENRGDCTFRVAPAALESPTEGAVLGCSAVDWDMDGDPDLTTGIVFRRNLLVESGERRLAIATHQIPTRFFLSSLTPAWGDWDKDGDPDCVLAGFGLEGALFRNTTYDATTPALERLALRVRPVLDSRRVARGLENAFGASVEVRVRGDEPGRVRRQFTASSHGYVQQSEYALTFALPAGPDAATPARGVIFDLLVDFPSREDRGILRVDRSVNPVLGGLELASLVEREITVFQSGLVRIDGFERPPTGPFEPRMESTGGLVLPRPGATLEEPSPVPAPSWFVGLELDTGDAVGPAEVSELVLDGALEPATGARCDANVWLWDVTPGAAPTPVHQERLATTASNLRSFVALEWLLKPDRVYRAVCRVTSLRSSPLVAVPGSSVRNDGGLSFSNVNPCDGRAVRDAALHADRAFVELRYHGALPRGARASRGAAAISPARTVK